MYSKLHFDSCTAAHNRASASELLAIRYLAGMCTCRGTAIHCGTVTIVAVPRHPTIVPPVPNN